MSQHAQILYTIDEVAETLRVPVATVRHWRANKRGPVFFRAGRRLLCRAADLDAFIEKLAKEATA